MDTKRCLVLRTQVDAVSMDEAVSLALDAAVSGHRLRIFAMNPEKVIAAQRNSALANILESAELLIPDGIGVVLALRLQGRSVERVPGSELMPALCEAAARHGLSVFLLGAKESVNRLAAQTLTRRCPGLRIAGRRDGYFAADESPSVVREINESGASMLFVALGSPRQEAWVAEYAERLTTPVIQGVGGTLDVLAGTVRRAPAFWLRLNLEWLYRLLSQPSRLLRQRALPLFALQLAWQQVRHRLAGRIDPQQPKHR